MSLEIEVSLKDIPFALVIYPVEVVLLHELKRSVPFLGEGGDLVAEEAYFLFCPTKGIRLANKRRNVAPSSPENVTMAFAVVSLAIT